MKYSSYFLLISAATAQDMMAEEAGTSFDTEIKVKSHTISSPNVVDTAEELIASGTRRNYGACLFADPSQMKDTT